MSRLRYIPGQFGNFTAERYGLIGHDSSDVMAWLSLHPEYRGSIGFDYGDGSDEVDVTTIFFPEAEDEEEVENGIGIEELVDNVRAIMGGRAA